MLDHLVIGVPDICRVGPVLSVSGAVVKVEFSVLGTVYCGNLYPILCFSIDVFFSFIFKRSCRS